MASQQPKYYGQDDIKPDFLQAQDQLKSAESTALTPKSNPAAPAKDQATTAENTPSQTAPTRSLYKGSGRTKASGGKLRQGKKRGRSAIAVLILVLAISGVGIFGSSSFLGSHLDALVTQITDTQYITMTLRKRSLLQQMLGGEVQPTNTLRQRFTKYDLTLSDDGSTIFYKNQSITASNFESVLDSNTEFRDNISKATYGRAANFFDESSEQYFNDMYQTRDLQRTYQQTGDRDTDDANYNQLMHEYFEGDADANINTAHDIPQYDEETGEPILDEEGNQVIERVLTGEDVVGKSMQGSPMQKAQSYLLGASRKVAAAGGIGCAVLKVGNLVSVAVASKDMYNAINYFLTQSEPQSKVKAGDGDSSGVHTWLTFLNTSTTSTVKDPTTNSDVELTGAPLEDDGMRALTGDLAPRASHTKYFSMERAFVSTVTALVTHYGSAMLCGGSRLAGAVVSIATIASGGFIKLSIGMLLDTILTTAMQAIVSAAVMAVLSALIPIIAETLFTNPYDNADGIPAGAFYARGAMLSNSTFLGRTTSGQGPSSTEAVLAFNHATDLILAQDAEVERARLSPFDASSPNTFFGNIVSRLLPLTATTNTVSTLSTINSVALSGLASLSPVHADGIGDAFLTTIGENCEVIEDIGAVGDPYCGARVTSDVSVLDLSINDAQYHAVIDPNLEYGEDGQETVKEGSPLAEFIRYLLLRKSPLGVPDAGIAAECQTDFSIFGKIPFIGNILDAINAVEEAACMDVATGKKFVNSPNNQYWQEEGKYYQLYVSTTRALDQFGSYTETGTVNPVLAYQQKYRAEHPLDTSPAGQLATISGLSKDDAELVLAIAEYGEFLANYDPTDRLDFSTNKEGQSIEDTQIVTQLEYNSPLKNDAAQARLWLPAQAILYADLRNRSHAA